MKKMKPPPGWGSSPRRVAPTDNTFRLVSCVVLLNFMPCVSAQPVCREKEFPVGGECCPMCYPDMGLVTWQECSSRNDTVCRCSPGYFCETQEGAHCSTCLPHTTCPPGQRLQRRGTYSQDTVCASCPTGTFSPGGTQEECLSWTKCKAWIEKEAEHGTSSTDAICSISWSFILLILVGLVIAGLGILIIICRRRRLHNSPVARELEPFQGDKQENTVRFPVTEVGLAVTEEKPTFNCENSG
ncbi:tumor necrosis factor receptor superfamily member 14 isoform X2 [Meriones unguiculatus]|uniref:tumor necrosis factor receptor superfamily member 14 isoform X2 n=1 Tax=Meriones unguiculatus TaxID=10047 RepID=UPI00293E1844|nr:tumor necrosis factor receptor superfamily member 14 isoform X2 [Meriones unguiculatus]